MITKKIKCREHGGYFRVEVRRGRPPVRCTEENSCDAQTIAQPKRGNQAAVRTGRATVVAAQSKTPTSAATPASASASAKGDRANWVEGRAATTKKINEIFKELIVLGWDARRSWIDNTSAELTATRGIEMLYVVVTNGKANTQYSLWDFEKPSTNGKPESKLPFDPDEIGDAELARYLVGNKVTWYNRLSGKTEDAFCGTDNIRVEHGYNAKGDEMPGERVIKFVDADQLKFRAFRLDSLIKVGR